jgi:transcription elongation factor Elf1
MSCRTRADRYHDAHFFHIACRSAVAPGGDRGSKVTVPTLKIVCPHCDHASEDGFEVLDLDTIDAMLCEHCGRQFWFFIMECHRCAHEQVLTWAHQPPPEALAMLTCEACQATFQCSNGFVQEESE